MTHISQFAVKDFDAYENSNELKEYQVEVVTFDGESETVYVEAYNEDEASNKAAAQVGTADYTMVYSYNYASLLSGKTVSQTADFLFALSTAFHRNVS